MKFSSRIFSAIIFLLMPLSVLVNAASADQLYKWVDDKGRVTYQSAPPPQNAASYEKTKISADVEKDISNKPAETGKEGVEDLPENNFAVTLYSKDDCSSCDRSRKLFQDIGIDFEEISLENNEEMTSQLDKKIGVSTPPIIKIGNKYIAGYNWNVIISTLKKQGIDISKESDKNTE